jgi:hypothetical protein
MGSFFRFVFQLVLTVVLVAWVAGLPALSWLGSVQVKTIGSLSEGTFVIVLVYQTPSVARHAEATPVVDSATLPRPVIQISPLNANRAVRQPAPQRISYSNQHEAGNVLAVSMEYNLAALPHFRYWWRIR